MDQNIKENILKQQKNMVLKNGNNYYIQAGFAYTNKTYLSGNTSYYRLYLITDKGVDRTTATLVSLEMLSNNFTTMTGFNVYKIIDNDNMFQVIIIAKEPEMIDYCKDYTSKHSTNLIDVQILN